MNSAHLKLALAALVGLLGLYFLRSGATGVFSARDDVQREREARLESIPEAEVTLPGGGVVREELVARGDGEGGDAAESVAERARTEVRIHIVCSVPFPEGAGGLRIYRGSRYESAYPEWQGEVDAEGKVTCALEPGDWWVALHAAPSTLFELRVPDAPEGIDWTQTLDHAHVVSGRCVDPGGSPVGGAEVFAAMDVDHRRAFPLLHANEDGRFRVLVGSRGEVVQLFAHTEALGTSLLTEVDPLDPTVEEVVITFAPRLSTLRGRVQTSEGEPLEGAEVRLLQKSGSLALVRPDEHQPLLTGADGRFEVAGLHPGRARVEARMAGYVTEVQRLTIEEENTEEVLLVMQPSRSLRVLVRAPGGEAPAPGATVQLSLAGAEAGSGEGPKKTTDRAGRVAFDGLPAGEIVVRARHPRLGFARALQVAAGQDEVEIILEPGETRLGRVEDDRGWPVQLKGALVEVKGTEGGVYTTSMMECDTDGTFELTHLPPRAALRVHVFDEGYDSYDRRFAPDEELLVKVQRKSWDASVLGRVVDGAGEPIQGADIAISAAGNPTIPMLASRSDGTFSFPEVPVGQFVLVVFVGDEGPRTLGPYQATAGPNDLGDLVIHEGGALRVNVTGTGGVAPQKGYCCLRTTEGLILLTSVLKEGSCRFDGVVPGEYLLSTYVRGYATPSEPMTIADGASEILDVELVRGLSVRLSCEVPRTDAQPNDKVFVEVRDGERLAFQGVLLQGAGGGYGTSFGLVPGSYRIEAWRSGQEERFTRSVVVGAEHAANGAQRIELMLR